ncbi:MAG: hypothetical protein BWY73_00909 [candidate division TA06 bacterium ADurb.Bin417]|uniref:Uncharacterized protein n=1 Tax=candidate division TA06 bacterium ADurb.Bin417 TaxID=1852828 RepID=A0A1V5MG06_UNCT6|nr:MAG: hypothetical protein BWY73_00909 [candidate division TA06 bacterium ADurb.Bin417]
MDRNGTGQFGADALGGLADQDHFGRLSGQCLPERPVGTALILAAQYQEYPAAVFRKRLEGAQGGIDIGGLGVVYVLDALFPGHRFEPVGQRLEIPDRPGHRFRRQPVKPGRGTDGQDILLVMHPPEAAGRNFQELFSIGKEEMPTVAEKTPLLLAAAVKEGPALESGAGHPALRVVVIEQRDIVAGLVFENPELGLPVRAEVRIAVQVVGGDVEQQREFRPEALDPLQLETAHLQDHRVGCGQAVNYRDEGGPDVAREDHRPAGRFQHVAQQGNHGTLAVGPGDRQDRGRAETVGQFQFAPDRDAALKGGLDRPALGRHAGTGHHQVQAFQERLRMAAQFHPDAGGLQFAPFRFEAGAAAVLGQADLGPASGQE